MMAAKKRINIRTASVPICSLQRIRLPRARRHQEISGVCIHCHRSFVERQQRAVGVANSFKNKDRSGIKDFLLYRLASAQGVASEVGFQRNVAGRDGYPEGWDYG